MTHFYMGIDQYGVTYHGLRHPRKDLLARLGRRRASKMYVDSKATGRAKHTGYVIAGRWITIYKVEPWKGGV